MWSFSLRAAARLVGMFTLMLLLVTAASQSTTRSPLNHSGYPGFSACELPCWAGILPTDTLTEDAVLLLREHLPEMRLEFQQVVTQITFSAAENFNHLSGVIYDDRGRISGLRIRIGVPLWQMLDALKTPTCVRMLSGGNGEEIVVISWEMDTHYISATLLLPDASAWRPDATVMVLGIFGPYPACDAPGGYPWRGFAPVWHYHAG